MKHFALVLTLIAFLTMGWAEAAHAVINDVVCSHAQIDVNTDDECVSDQSHDHEKIDLCLDCCCHHTHLMTKLLPPAVSQLEFKTARFALFAQEPRSRDLSPLYRPPIV